MNKKRFTVIIIVFLLLVFNFAYHRIRTNKIIESYDFVTLVNVRSTLEDIIKDYENGNEIIPRNYSKQLNAYSWYFSLSHRFNISLDIDKISGIIVDGISEEEFEYLTNIRDNLRVFLDKINNERNEISIKRIIGVFNKANLNELDSILGGAME